MTIDQKLISRLENLAKLELSDVERNQIQNDLNNILTMVEKLQELKTENVEPLVYVSEEVNKWRRDEVEHQVSNEKALQNAPADQKNHFEVPKVIDL